MGDFIDEYYADKDLSLLKKLTLIIPTHNRNYYLSRCLWYHAHFPFGQIIVADSSPEEKKVINRETVEKIRKMFGADILYLEYEPETEKYGGDIYRKWGDAVQHAETEYSQICTDKAFKIPVSQIQALEFLEKNEDYVSATFGKFIKLEYEWKCMIQQPTKRSKTGDDSLSRFSESLSQSWPGSILLDIMHTDLLKHLYQTMQESRIDDIRYGELYLGYTGHLYGKYHYSNNGVSAIRDVRNVKYDLVSSHSHRKGSSESSTTRYPSIRFYEYVGQDIGRKYRDCYECAIRMQLLKHTTKSEEEVKQWVDDLHYTIYNLFGCLPKNRMLIDVYIKNPCLSKIISLIPMNLKSIIVKIYRFIKNNNLCSIQDSEELSLIQNICDLYDLNYLTDRPIL